MTSYAPGILVVYYKKFTWPNSSNDSHLRESNAGLIQFTIFGNMVRKWQIQASVFHIKLVSENQAVGKKIFIKEWLMHGTALYFVLSLPVAISIVDYFRREMKFNTCALWKGQFSFPRLFSPLVVFDSLEHIPFF